MQAQLALSILLLIISAANGQQWKKADLTNYESYPDCCNDEDADQTECDDYSACDYQGEFAYIGHRSKEWVQTHNIISIHNKFRKKYERKTFELRSGSKKIKAQVVDECNDEDCEGCCTENSERTGFLIDIEKYTMQKFGKGDGIIEWRCVDC